MSERRILALANPDGYAEAQTALIPIQAWRRFYSGKPVQCDDSTRDSLALLRAAKSAGACVDVDTLAFVDEAGEPRPFVPHPPVVRYAGLLAMPEVIGDGSVIMVPGEDDMTADQIAAYKGDE